MIAVTARLDLAKYPTTEVFLNGEKNFLKGGLLKYSVTN